MSTLIIFFHSGVFLPYSGIIKLNFLPFRKKAKVRMIEQNELSQESEQGKEKGIRENRKVIQRDGEALFKFI